MRNLDYRIKTLAFFKWKLYCNIKIIYDAENVYIKSLFGDKTVIFKPKIQKYFVLSKFKRKQFLRGQGNCPSPG